MQHADTLEADSVESALKALRARVNLKLKFPCALEQRFESDTAEARSARLWTEGWLTSLPYSLLLFGDYHLGHTRFANGLIVRCGIVLPCMFATNEIARRVPRALIRESSFAAVTVLIAWSNLYLSAGVSPLYSVGAQVGFLLTLIVANLILRLRFRYAVSSSLLCLAAFVWFLFRDAQLTSPDKLTSGTPVFVGALFILFGGFSLERQERLSYLLQLRSEMQTSRLALLNAQLERLSSRDPLTGLANRAALDQRLDMLWTEATTRATCLALIMMDVDHFKMVNDRHGHPYGDEVLRRVASLVREGLRRQGDFAARYGGEEIVILLPDTSLENAEKVAERIRSMIELAGSPERSGAQRGSIGATTVSCGVACLVGQRKISQQQLLEAADDALYAAKRNGRNVVCLAQQ